MPVNAIHQARPELVIGLVGPVGCRLDALAGAVKTALTEYDYRGIDIRLSSLLTHFSGWQEPQTATGAARIQHLQRMGNAFRRSAQDGAALARAAIADVRTKRSELTGHPDKPADATAYILRQLKHPVEVELLREIYGSAFLLLGAHAPREVRLENLSEQLAREDLRSGQEHRYRNDASEIVDVDEKENDTFGQNTRDTYPLADCFVNMGVSGGESAVVRFMQLVFGHPFRTPSPDEFAMYQASSASLRSSDDKRQVGAVIVSLIRDAAGRVTNSDVVSVGMNEVPRAGGGFYWDQDSPDHRDQALLLSETDRAAEIKTAVLAEMIGKIQAQGWFRSDLVRSAPQLAKELLPEIAGTQFMDIGEFGRPVHAEMAALIDSARRGVAVNDHTMYVTTFPCHNCAKHIIAAGLKKVVYLEPYPKSRATFLHKEEINLDPSGVERDGRVTFAPFSGVSPRKYRELFSMTQRGVKNGLSQRRWSESRKTLVPSCVVKHAALAYIAGERQALELLPSALFHCDRASILPADEPAPI